MRRSITVSCARNRGFTLPEVLVVLLLISLIFGAVLAVLVSVGRGSLEADRRAGELDRRAFLLYRLRHQLEGALRGLRLERREDGLYLAFVTPVGEVHPGVVGVRYRYAEGRLYYCENPYPRADLLFCEEGKEFSLGDFEDFEVRVFSQGKWREGFGGGLPEKVEILLGDSRMVIPLRVGERFP